MPAMGARVVLLAACLMLSCPPASATSPYQTDYPLELVLPRLDGGEIDIAALRGQWVVLNYWATWCAPCRKEIPELQALHDQRADVTVLGLAYEEAEPAEFEAFLAELNVTYPVVLVDVFNPPQPFGAPRVLPTTVVLNPAGHAVRGFVGPVTRAELESVVAGQAEP